MEEKMTAVVRRGRHIVVEVLLAINVAVATVIPKMLARPRVGQMAKVAKAVVIATPKVPGMAAATNKAKTMEMSAAVATTTGLAAAAVAATKGLAAAVARMKQILGKI